MILDHVQIAAPPGSEDEARAFYGGLLGLDELPKPEPMRASGGVWSYGLYINAPGNTAWGNTQGTGRVVTGDGLAQTLTVYGRIPPGQYNATAGLYTDTVQVSFTF